VQSKSLAEKSANISSIPGLEDNALWATRLKDRKIKQGCLAFFWELAFDNYRLEADWGECPG
jgi:hypothetical protein